MPAFVVFLARRPNEQLYFPRNLPLYVYEYPYISTLTNHTHIHTVLLKNKLRKLLIVCVPD